MRIAPTNTAHSAISKWYFVRSWAGRRPTSSPHFAVRARREANGAAQPTQQQPQQPLTPDQLRNSAIEQLANGDYALDEETAKQLVMEPEKVLPQLAAKIHVHIASQMGQVVQQLLPAMVGNIVEQRVKAIRAESEFFDQFPQLKDPRFRSVVTQSLQLAKQASPNATRAQIMNDGAVIAINRLRLQQRNAAPPQPVTTPPQPFQPAMGGGAAPPQPQPQNLRISSKNLRWIPTGRSNAKWQQ